MEGKTLWLSLNQIASLFGRDKSVISRHLANIFRTKELDRQSVVAVFATTAADGKTYRVEHFNLDAILSVGYRVNSKEGAQFRIWATGILAGHLVKGYTTNSRRLIELKQTLCLTSGNDEHQLLIGEQASAIVRRVLAEEILALAHPDKHEDEHTHNAAAQKPTKMAPVTLEEARKVVEGLRRTSGVSGLLGKHGYQNLRGSPASGTQPISPEDRYRTLEEKAALLLYLLLKNESVVDGN
ncbi:MAG: virulence RhuM family protein [Acidobacteriota bacterium]